MKRVYRAKYVLPISADPICGGEVLVENGSICEVGDSVSTRHPGVDVHDLGRAALLPGFVNAHSHIDYTMSRNRYDGLNLWDFLRKVAFTKGRVPDYELILASARLGAALCARSGITCLGDSSFSGAAVAAMRKLGLRGIVYKEIFGQSMGAEYPQRFARALDEVGELQSRAGERVRIGISPHSVYTSNAEVLELCAASNVPVATHLAETHVEADYTCRGTGPIAELRRELGYEPMTNGLRPTEVLLQAGLLRKDVALAHCIELTSEEVGLIAHSGASVVHCPRSNARLGAGVAPVLALRAAGAIVGLGTDSAATCGELDFFDEMRSALGVQRASAEDASVFLAKEVLDVGTAGGAAALGLESQIGKLEPGMRADMIAVDMSDTLPGEDIYLAVLSRSPRDVKLVLVDGEPIEVDIEARTQELRELMERFDIA